jgi:hypothetical protein
MPKRNVSKHRLEKLIDSVVSEITIAKAVNYEEAEQAVNQLIDLAGSAALALGLDDKAISLSSDLYEFTLTTKYIK